MTKKIPPKKKEEKKERNPLSQMVGYESSMNNLF
jgi:hypothetical protein